MSEEPDFRIEAHDGSILAGWFFPGERVAIYASDGSLVRVGPADLEWIRSFGRIKAGSLTMARLELDAGTQW